MKMHFYCISHIVTLNCITFRKQKLTPNEKVNRDAEVPLCFSWYPTRNVTKQDRELENTVRKDE
jgi:hypothetical protein